jgi:hypothetical protein
MKVRKASVVEPHTVEAKDDAPASDPPLHTHSTHTDIHREASGEGAEALDIGLG